MSEPNLIIEAQNLKKLYPVKRGFFESLTSNKSEFVHAVNDVSFKIFKGETFGLVGESGCGKSTTGFLLLNLLEKTDGRVFFKGTDLSLLSNKDLRKLREYIQIIFQNPYDSLSPRFNVFDIIAEPLRVLKVLRNEKEIEKAVISILEDVGLSPPEDYRKRFPHELSGGQRQRVGVARAFVLNPAFIVADEPVSMLDVSIRTGILKIMQKLIKDKGTSFLFITHDLALARHMCDRVAVMYLGRIIETGPTEQILKQPVHPYTKALLAAVPTPDPEEISNEDLPIIGEVPGGIHLPIGCNFHPRCPYAIEKCKEVDPQLESIGTNHLVACIRHDDELVYLNKGL
ncbi:MAG: Oligopeptide transport ATP-binding protein OppF [Candidatus Heimdallarchaeota archaeon LC_2]|nr:MAG: Oligopeptide transport ATP-binding protein OppF [Candidatus Heimdallarchaeota archaeon LC_2]